MVIIVCGPPHSGKSVFIDNLIRILPTNGLVLIRGCQDGEGLWSSGPNRGLVELVRQKEGFTQEFVDRVCELIDRHKNSSRIVLVDVGGIISKENMQIFSHCDGYITVCRDEIDENAKEEFKTTPKDWMKACERAGLKPVALLTSSLKKGEKLTVKKDTAKREPIVGRISGLNRGEVNTESIVLRTVARHTCDLTKGEQTNNDFLDIDGHKLARLLGYSYNNNIKQGGNSRVVSWDMDAIRKIYELVENPTAQDESISKKISKKSKQKLMKTFVSIDEEAKKANDIEDINERRLRQRELADFHESMHDLPLEIMVGNINDNHIMVALCLALKEKGVPNILVFDSLRRIPYYLQQFPEKDGRMAYNSGSIFAREIESKNSVFMDIDMLNHKMTRRDYESIVIPKVDDNKALYLSGRMPQWLYASICMSSGAKEIYVLNPGKGFICIKSDQKEKLGTIVGHDNVPEINISKYFTLKKAKSLPLDSLELNEVLIEPESRCEEDKVNFDLIGGREYENVLPETVFSGMNPPDTYDEQSKARKFYYSTGSRQIALNRMKEERRLSGLRKISNASQNDKNRRSKTKGK